MDNLFGVPLTSILVGLLLVTVAIFALLAWIAWRNPLLVRMGLRNVARRKTQTALIVIGLMLSTLIISAAFATGDTVGFSVTNTFYNDLGEADVVAAFDRDLDAAEGRNGLHDADVEAIRDAFAGDANVDAVTGVLQTPVPALNSRARLSEPRALFVGVDDTADGFHGLITERGEVLLAADLAADQAYVTVNLAEDIQIEVGDTLTVFVDNVASEFTVAGIIRDTALTASTAFFSNGNPAGGVVARIESVRTILGETDRVDLIVVSARGTVRDTLDLVEGVANRFEDAALERDVPAGIIFDKEEAIALAEQIGSVFVTFFLVFGLFSIAAGVMLIFLTFVMLAAERRSEMGMARAIGMQRLHLTESFIAEGMTYNLGSAMVGALLGIAVAYALIQVMGAIFSEFGLNIVFNFNPVGFLIAYLLGVVITFITVAASSWRAANLNIVRAIRDLPEPAALGGGSPSIGDLARGAAGALWYLAWIAILISSGLALFLAFTLLVLISVPFFLAFVIVTLVLLPAVVFGLIALSTSALSEMQGWWRWLAVSIWGFTMPPLWAASWGLTKSKKWADRNRNAGGWAVVMLIIGAIATWWGGWVSQQAFAYASGTTLILLAIAMLAVYFGSPSRRTFSIASIVVLWYWMLPLPFSLLFEDGKGWTDPLDGALSLVGLGHDTVNGNIEMFFVSGICITAASTMFVIFNADRLLGAVGRLQGVFGGITPAIRTAISYPLASKFRTGMTLAMFTLVMFSLVVMATLNFNFTQLFLGEAAQGGFEVQVTANPNNRIGDLRAALDDEGFEDSANIEAVGTLRVGVLDVKPTDEPADEFHPYFISSLDREFLDAADFPLSTFAIGYDDDQDVLDALAGNTTVVLANELLLSHTQSQNFEDSDQLSIEGSIIDLQENPWEPIPLTLRNRESGEQRTVHIIGFVDSAIISGVVPQWIAIFTQEFVVQDMLPDDFGEVFFVNTTAGTDASAIELAAAIESTLLERGVQGESLRQLVDDAAALSNGFSALFQGFMSLGLVVGIAALGVIAFRTVAERRQQIGMLRAIGYSRRLVAISFFLESSFIAVTGVAMGVILGAALSFNLLTSPEFTNGADIDFGLPWLRLAIIVSVAYVASALMTLWPARSASRVPVAEALRYE